MRTTAATLLLLAASACASAPRPAAEARPAPAPAGPASALARSGYEAGQLSPSGPALAGPLVVTWLADGTPAALARRGEAQPLAVVVGPLATPLHVPAGLELRGAGAPGAWTGYRPQGAALARPLEGFVGKQVRVAQGGPPELWWLREVGADHLLLERSRTYRMVPLRRVSEISWTELTGIDRTPVLVLAPE